MMSSQFSYELDERQIRIMMQDAEVGGNEALWNKFEDVTTIESTSPVNIGHLIPSFNFSVSRSIIVPVLFVALIGGLSAMLFSFVDFKKKESIDQETPLVANPANFKKQDVVVEKIETPKTEKVVPVIEEIVVKTEPVATIASKPVVPAPATEIKKEVPVKAAEEKAKIAATTALEPKKEVPQKIYPKKKTRKVKSEIIPTINATTITNLNEGVNEPELDLK